MKPSNKVSISSKFALGEAEAIFAKFAEDSFKVFEDRLQSNSKRDGNTAQPYCMDVPIEIDPVAASKPTDHPYDCKEATAGGLDTEKVPANDSELDSKLLEVATLSVRIAENRPKNARVQRSRARHDLAVHRVKSIRQASASNPTSMTGPPIVSILSKARYISCDDHECTCVRLGPTVSVSGHNNMGSDLAIRIKIENSDDVSKNDDQLTDKAPDGQGGQSLHIKTAAAIPRTTGYSADGTESTRNAITDSSQSIPPASPTVADEAPQPHISEIPDILTLFNATFVDMEKIMHEALKTFGEVHDLTFTTGDKDAQIQSATAAGDIKLSEAQATTAAKDTKHTEVQHPTVTEDDKHTEAQTATILNKFHRAEVEGTSDSDEEGGLLLEVDDEEEWEVLDAARSTPK